MIFPDTMEDARSIFAEQGFVIFKTGVTEEWIMEVLARYIGSIRGIWEKTYIVDFDPEAPPIKNSVSRSITELPPHTDGTFENDLPKQFILQSIRADKLGYGVSVFWDGWKALDKVSEESKNLLMETPFEFTRKEYTREVILRAPIIQEVRGNYQIRYKNDRRHPLTPVDVENDAAKTALLEFETAMKETKHEYQLNPGDILWINNHRMTHGRSALSGECRRTIRRYWV